jgi:pimeloyl-ACP methyl ester carboxylesterase
VKIVLISLSTLLFITFVAAFAITWYLCNRLMYPERVPITHVPTLPYESVQLETMDHVTIRGWFIPAPPGIGRAPAILLLHGVADNRNAFNIDCRATDAKDICPPNSPYAQGSYPTFIEALHQHGYAVLAIDQRAQGESGGDFCTYGLYETRDVATALAYLQRRPDVDSKRLGIYGSSLGAITAIHAAALMPAFWAVAVESPFADLKKTLQVVTAPLIRLPGWMVWPILKLYQLRTGVDFTQLRNIDDMAALGDRPFYAIGDMKDSVTLPGDARRLYNASHSPLRQLWEVPDTGHTDSRFYHPVEFDQRLIAFFDEALKK